TYIRVNNLRKINNLKQTIFRLSTYIPILLLLIIVINLFKPSLNEIIVGIVSGMVMSVHDFIIEYYAYKHKIWICYGGFQKIWKYNLHVPLDMLILFFIGGFELSIFSTFPEFLRQRGIFIGTLIDYPIFDFIWILIILIIIALIGAAGDFLSKKFGVWENSKNWTFWKCAFYAWLPLLIMPVVISRILLFFF
ncbi:MAG: hypothetical protein ACTSPQ_20550, partial [Candidatus Helarchaeota archaeon]